MTFGRNIQLTAVEVQMRSNPNRTGQHAGHHGPAMTVKVPCQRLRLAGIWKTPAIVRNACQYCDAIDGARKTKFSSSILFCPNAHHDLPKRN
jgi:hypothetical protein